MAIRRLRNGRAMAVSLLAVAAAAVTAAAATPAVAAPATGEIRLAGTASAVPGSYIVVLKDSVKMTRAASLGGTVLRTFESVNGYEASMTEAQAKKVAGNSAVAYVEQNQKVSLLATQNNPTWGLDRIDQRRLPLSRTFTYPNTASNVTAYVIDTGIQYSHSDFGGRASFGYDAVGSGGVDCNGHGTHVAGTVGGTTYGVAKQVRLVGVRVLNCSGSGTNAGVIAGVDWVTRNARKPAVANMSLGGGINSTLDTAVSRSIASGVSYAVAAGNSNANACNFSPARVPTAITVGSTTSTDARSSFSNWGNCLDIFAPGSSITSAWYTGGTNTISGTSMASPHVAGAAALVLSTNTAWTPQQVRDYLVTNATPNVVTSPGSGSPNRLLFVVN